MMKLWLLRPASYDSEPRPGYNWGKGTPWHNYWDCYFGHVVRAETEAEARQMVPTGDEEGYLSDKVNPWLDEHSATCVEITVSGVAEVIISDFHAA